MSVEIKIDMSAKIKIDKPSSFLIQTDRDRDAKGNWQEFSIDRRFVSTTDGKSQPKLSPIFDRRMRGYLKSVDLNPPNPLKKGE
jgi:hypothetical protein